jgi:lipoprotein-anchoring transpeptidase ErfK/SrfK
MLHAGKKPANLPTAHDTLNDMMNNMHTPRPIRRPARTSPAPSLILIGLAAAAAGAVTLAVLALSLIILAAPDRVARDVSIAGVSLAGLTEASARDRLRAELPPHALILRDGTRQIVVSPLEIGITADLDATLAAALDAPAGTSLPLILTVDLPRTQSGLLAIAPRIEIAPQPGINGRVLDIPVILDRLRVDVNGEAGDGVLELDMIDIPAPVPQITHIVERGQELALIARQYGVSVQDILSYNNIANPDLIYPGQALLIPAEGVYVPPNPPPAPTNIGRSIVVSTGEQRIYAYEDGRMVRTHLVSTGRILTPTVLGDYRVYAKYRATDMSGPGYHLTQVPFTMYFHLGYGIHGTYWHNSFGRPMSHGCVNLPTAEAEWFFNFASIGTPVRVI